ncbi:MAG: outer membrane protein transport protein [Tahibacter sp.]
MKCALSTAIALALIGASGSAFAITDSETNASIPFSFSSPGARSLGMAGAFLGLADDATAAYANPAGLTQLAQTEISLEVRRTDYSTPYIDGGAATANPYDLSGLNISSADTSKNNVSFLSVVIPHDRWAFSFYRQELARFSTDFTTLNGADLTVGNDEFVLFPFRSTADLKIVDYGFATGFKVNDKISLGAGIAYYDFSLQSLTARLDDEVTPPVFASVQNQNGDDKGFGFNLGARFRLHDTLSLGLSYRRAPSFRYSARSVLLAGNGVPLDPPITLADTDRVHFDIPDIWGVGLSWRPSDALVINFDVDRVEYSQLTENVDSLFQADSAAQRLQLDDGTEIHLGAEYTFASMKHPFSVRGGAWRDPRHSVQFNGVPTTVDEAALATLFAGGRGSDTHYSFGGGWAFTKFQLDFAADLSEGLDTYSMSGVYRF